MAIENLSNECLQNIFNNLEDSNSLFSSLFVNKRWCNNAVITLWKKPFNYNLALNRMAKMIPVLLSQSTKEQRFELNLQDIPTKTTFEYGWFIQQVDLPILFESVELWFKGFNKKVKCYVDIMNIMKKYF